MTNRAGRWMFKRKRHVFLTLPPPADSQLNNQVLKTVSAHYVDRSGR